MSDAITPKELSFMEAIKYIQCEAGEPTMKTGKDYYQHAKDNSTAFDMAVAMEQIEVTERPTIAGNEAKVLKMLRALRKVKTFTDDQEITIKKLIEEYEAGNVAKAVSANIVKDVKALEDPLEMYFAIVNNVPEPLLKGKKENTTKHEGKTEIILSDYLVPGEK